MDFMKPVSLWHSFFAESNFVCYHESGFILFERIAANNRNYLQHNRMDTGQNK